MLNDRNYFLFANNQLSLINNHYDAVTETVLSRPDLALSEA